MVVYIFFLVIVALVVFIYFNRIDTEKDKTALVNHIAKERIRHEAVTEAKTKVNIFKDNLYEYIDIKTYHPLFPVLYKEKLNSTLLRLENLDSDQFRESVQLKLIDKYKRTVDESEFEREYLWELESIERDINSIKKSASILETFSISIPPDNWESLDISTKMQLHERNISPNSFESIEEVSLGNIRIEDLIYFLCLKVLKINKLNIKAKEFDIICSLEKLNEFYYLGSISNSFNYNEPIFIKKNFIRLELGSDAFINIIDYFLDEKIFVETLVIHNVNVLDLYNIQETFRGNPFCECLEINFTKKPIEYHHSDHARLMVALFFLPPKDFNVVYKFNSLTVDLKQFDGEVLLDFHNFIYFNL